MNQRDQNRRYANRVRSALRELRAGMKAGKVDLAEALDHPLAQNQPLGRVLGWMPRMGRYTGLEFLRRVGITDGFFHRPISALTLRQKGCLVEAADERTERMASERQERKRESQRRYRQRQRGT